MLLLSTDHGTLEHQSKQLVLSGLASGLQVRLYNSRELHVELEL